jgi:hypothetical protein
MVAHWGYISQCDATLSMDAPTRVERLDLTQTFFVLTRGCMDSVWRWTPSPHTVLEYLLSSM